jgi:hypothetical protein
VKPWGPEPTRFDRSEPKSAVNDLRPNCLLKNDFGLDPEGQPIELIGRPEHLAGHPNDPERAGKPRARSNGTGEVGMAQFFELGLSRYNTGRVPVQHTDDETVAERARFNDPVGRVSTRRSPIRQLPGHSGRR